MLKEDMKWTDEQRLIEKCCTEEEKERRGREEEKIRAEKLKEGGKATLLQLEEQAITVDTPDGREEEPGRESGGQADQGNKSIATRRGGCMEYALT